MAQAYIGIRRDMKYIVSYSYKVFTSSVVEAKNEEQAVKIVRRVTPEIEIDSVFNTNSWGEND